MSYQAVEAVMQRSQTVGTERLVLMVIATHADAETMTAYLGETTLCKEANVKERNLRYTLAKLKASGELQCVVGGGRGRANLYQITLPQESDNGAASCPVSTAQAEAQKGQPVAPLSDEKGHHVAGFVDEKRGNVASEKGQSIAEKGQPIAPQPEEPERTKEKTEASQTVGARAEGGDAAAAERLLAYYGERVKPVGNLNHQVRAAWITRIALRIREGWPESDLRKMFDGCALDDWKDRWKWNKVTDILKDRDSMLHFLNLADEMPRHASREGPRAGRTERKSNVEKGLDAVTSYITKVRERNANGAG